jgi:two-component system OmpR family sensor kinase
VRRPGFKVRLTLWHGAAVALILLGVTFVADRALSRIIGAQVDDTLVTLAETEAAEALDDPREGIHLHDVQPDAAGLPSRRLDKLVQIIDMDGQILARSATLGAARLPASLPLLTRLRAGEVVLETLPDFAEDRIRLVSLPIAVEGRVRYAVQVGTSLHATDTFLRAAGFLFLGGAVAILVAVTAIGVVLARGALRPVDQIVARARLIGAANLTERLPVPGSADELGRLAATLNEMLDRIERSVESQRRFTADASHELRSPLSRLRSELEVTLRRPRTLADYEAVLRSALEEVERLSRLTEELLMLARLDSGEVVARPEAPVALAPLVETELNRLKPEADARQITVAVTGPPGMAVQAPGDALGLVIANLLHNAIKFSPPTGRVTVTLRPEGTEAVLSVANSGSGIPPEDLPRVFERFYRGTPSRSPDLPGVGLGLAIARAIVEAHGGRIAVESTRGAPTTFTVRLPLAT